MRPVARRSGSILFIVGLCLLWASAAHGAIALVANTAKQSAAGNAITTDAIDTTGATLLVIGITYAGAVGSGTPTDSNSNTWVSAVEATDVARTGFRLWYVKNPTVGSGHTFTGGTTASFSSVFVAAFSGTDITANVDQTNFATNQGSPCQPGSVTPGVDNEVLVTGLSGNAGGATYTIGSSYVTTNTLDQSGAAYGGGLAYLVQTSAGASNPAWTSGNAASLTPAIATFKSAAAAASGRSGRGRVF